MARMEGSSPDRATNIRPMFRPRVRLDASQVIDRRNAPKQKGSLMSYIRSKQKLARVQVKPVTTAQMRANQRIMKPYRKLHIGAMRVRGGK